MSIIPTITLPPCPQESRWVAVNDLRFFVQELEQKPDSPMHQLALDALYQLCGIQAQPEESANGLEKP